MSFFEFKNQKTDPTKILGENIASLRKKAGMTQEELAARLHITYQAVSKWENGKACPDPAFLPVLADLFNVSIDFLFGRETSLPDQSQMASATVSSDKKEETEKSSVQRTTRDPKDYYLEVWRGDHMVCDQKILKQLPEITIRGEIQNLTCYLNLCCDTVAGDVSVSGGYAECGDVGGNVTSDSYVECGDVGGNITCDSYVECGDVGGSITCDGYVECGDVGGNVTNDGYVECGDVNGGITSDGYVECGGVGGSVSAGDYVECGDVGGNVSAGDYVECGDVAGQIQTE